MTQIGRTGNKVYFFNIIYVSCSDVLSVNVIVKVKIVMMEHLWCAFVVNAKTVATDYSYRLLQCCDPQFRLFDP